MKIGKSAVVLLSALLVVSAPRPWLTPVRAATAVIATHYGWRGLRLFGFGYGSGATSCCARR